MNEGQTSSASRAQDGTSSKDAERQHTPHQILGPYFDAIHSPIATNDLTVIHGRDGRAQGEIIEIKGRILRRNGAGVSSARFVIWQSNCFGRYAHPNDSNPAPLDSNFVGSAEFFSDCDGYYRFKTVKPAAYPTGQGRMRSPHIHFEVQGKYDRLITQMYFPGEPLNTSDPLLLSVNHPGLLIAKPMPSLDIVACPIFNFDIVLMRG
jgi:protocatechuate 3,4-dioxygenase beta subunit